MQNTALLVIDVQNALFMGDKLYNGASLLQNIRALLDRARSLNMPVIYVQHCDDSYLKPESPGWAIHSDIAPLPTEPCVQKRSCDSFFQTNLSQILQEKGIEQLILSGLQTEFCVDTTIRNAFSRGYKLFVVCDAHSTFSTKILPAEKIIEHHNFIFRRIFGKGITTQEMLTEMNV